LPSHFCFHFSPSISAITNYYNVPQSELKIKYIENPIGENASPLVTQIIFKNDDHKLTIKFTPVLIQADAAQAQVNRVSRRYNKDSNSVDNLLEKSIKEYGEYSTIDKKKYRKQKENRPGLSESEYQANYKHLWCTKISADNVEKCERGNDLALLRLGQRTLSLSTMIDVSQIQN